LENDAMTMPDEQMRALRFGGETLNEVVGDNSLPAATRQRAQSALQHYRRPADQMCLPTAERATLPPDWAAALTAVQALLRDLRRQPGMTDTLRRSIDVTLRHFPDEGLIERLASLQHCAECLQPERPCHA
jgi:hypothetical protein